MRWKIIALSGLAILLLCGALFAFAYSRGRYPGTPLDATPIALLGARIYDPGTDSLITDVAVLIRGREITAVEPFTAVPEDARVLRVSGLTLLPGFIDSHLHMSAIRPRDEDGRREIGATRYLWRFVRRFPERRRRLIESGVTTAKSLGDPYPWIASFAERIEEHDLAGPRIFAAGPMFTAAGGHPVPRLRAAGQGDTSFIAQVTRQLSESEGATVALNQLSGRIDFVSAVLESEGATPSLSSRLLAAITATAHERGLRVLAHVASMRDLRKAIASGADGIEHLPRDGTIDPLSLDLLRAQRIFVDPTLTPTIYELASLRRDTASLRLLRGNARQLHQAGVRLLVGSDAPRPGAYFGRTVHEEMRALVELGLSPREAIAAATSSAAEHLGLGDRLGSIAPGKWADIVAVGGDPLSDITSTADIYLVIADGQVLLDRLNDRPQPKGVIAGASPHGAADALTERLQ